MSNSAFVLDKMATAEQHIRWWHGMHLIKSLGANSNVSFFALRQLFIKKSKN